MNIHMHSQTDETTVNLGNFDIGLLETICVKSVVGIQWSEPNFQIKSKKKKTVKANPFHPDILHQIVSTISKVVSLRFVSCWYCYYFLF